MKLKTFFFIYFVDLDIELI